MEMTVKWVMHIALSALETWIVYKFFAAYLTRNAVKERYYLISIAAYFSFQMLSYVYQSSMFSTALYYFFFAAAITVIFFSDSLQNKITTALLFVIMNYACKAAVATVMLVLGLQEIVTEGHTFRIIMNPWSQMFACLLFLLSLWGTSAIRRLRLNRQDIIYTVLSYLFPVSTMATVIIIISTRSSGESYDTVIKFFYFYTSLNLFSASIGLFYLLEKNILLDISSEKSSVMEELLAMQRRHYARLEASQKEMHGLRHDIKNHMYCLHALMDKGHTGDAKKYIEELYMKNRFLTGITYSGNAVMDSIIGNGLPAPGESDIDVRCSVIVPPSLNIEDVDLCILFGNLLDNAVEACERIRDPLQKKYIVLNVNVRKDYLFVHIENSFTGEINKQNNMYKTIKIGSQCFGIGLLNIRKVVDKYNGELSVEHANKVFNVSVMLSLNG